MNYNILYRSFIASAILFVGAASWSCSGEGKDHNHDHDHESETTEDQSGHSDKPSLLTVHIDDHDAEILGIEVKPVEKGLFRPALLTNAEISSSTSGYSVVVAPTSGTLIIPDRVAVGAKVTAGETIATIDPSKVTGSDIEGVNAATLRSTRDEYERMKKLKEKGLVTASQLNSAREAYEIAQATVSKAGTSRRATAPTAGTLTELLLPNGAYVQAGDQIATVSRLSRLTLKANLPDRYASVLPTISGVKVEIPGREGVIDLGDYNLSPLSDAVQSQSTGGYIPVVFTFDNPGLSSGRNSARAYLLGAQRQDVLTVPVSAVVEDQGNYFVYTVPEEMHYLKTPVETGASDGERYEIRSGLKAGDRIVTRGTSMVRMAQSQGMPVQGHNHNH